MHGPRCFFCCFPSTTLGFVSPTEMPFAAEKKKESQEMLKKKKKTGIHPFVSQSLVLERAFLLSVTLPVLVHGVPRCCSINTLY